MNGYELSRNFFDWTFENPQKVNPNHIALYFFCVEHCNRLGWKNNFGLPTTMAKEAIGIRSYNTYIKTINDLVEFGFIIMIERSKNQYSSNIIALSNFDKALNKALDKALIKHGTKHTTKQSESTRQSISSIDKQETIKQKTKNKEPKTNIFSIFMEAYNDFYFQRNQIKPKIIQLDWIKITEIGKFLIESSNTKDTEGGLNAWNYILGNWDKLPDFERNAIELKMISMNINRIINYFKNHKRTVKANGKQNVFDIQEDVKQWIIDTYGDS